MCFVSADQLGLFSVPSGASFFSVSLFMLPGLISVTAYPLYRFCSLLHLKENGFFLLSGGCCCSSSQDLNNYHFFPVLPALNSHNITENQAHTVKQRHSHSVVTLFLSPATFFMLNLQLWNCFSPFSLNNKVQRTLLSLMPVTICRTSSDRNDIANSEGRVVLKAAAAAFHCQLFQWVWANKSHAANVI